MLVTNIPNYYFSFHYFVFISSVSGPHNDLDFSKLSKYDLKNWSQSIQVCSVGVKAVYNWNSCIKIHITIALKLFPAASGTMINVLTLEQHSLLFYSIKAQFIVT